MSDRPKLSRDLDGDTFRNYYYLKEELVDFCRKNDLPTSGGKIDLTERIACFLDTGKVIKPASGKKMTVAVGEITEDSIIESGFVCSEKHRAFFKDKIDKSFSFNVMFQRWLKENAGKTYKDAIEAYFRIMSEKKSGRTTIDRQFEYNTYIRDFFDDNKGKSLQDAIKCWKYKKSLAGHNKYEKDDLIALKERAKGRKMMEENMCFVYRKAESSDSEKIEKLFKEMLRTIYHTNDVERYEDGYLDKFFEGSDDLIYVAELDKEVVAYISVEVYKGDGYTYLDDLSVTEKCRDKGVGTKLIRMAEEYSKSIGVNTIVFHVDKSNERAHELYIKLGYKDDEDQGNRIRMVKDYGE